MAEKEAQTQAWRAEREKEQEEGFNDGLKGPYKEGSGWYYQRGHEEGIERAKHPLS